MKDTWRFAILLALIPVVTLAACRQDSQSQSAGTRKIGVASNLPRPEADV
jgi:hypothetical protein